VKKSVHVVVFKSQLNAAFYHVCCLEVVHPKDYVELLRAVTLVTQPFFLNLENKTTFCFLIKKHLTIDSFSFQLNTFFFSFLLFFFIFNLSSSL
jgi:hypothetical protein